MVGTERRTLDYESQRDFVRHRRWALVKWFFRLSPSRRIAIEFTLWMLGFLIAPFLFAIAGALISF
jgi:hypothetical protein